MRTKRPHLKDCGTVHKAKDICVVLATHDGGSGTELSVLISVRLKEARTNALLDSGVGLSVIDLGSLREMGLELLMENKHGWLFGLSR